MATHWIQYPTDLDCSARATPFQYDLLEDNAKGQALNSLSFTAIDFETANPNRASVCAVGMVRVRNGRLVAEFSTLVQPPPGADGFSEHNTRIHGITAADVVGAPEWGDLASKLAEFIGDDVLVAHNASFDRSVFERAFDSYDLDWPTNSWVCTMNLARKTLVLPNYGLPWVTDHLELSKFDHHDAVADARAAAEVLLALAGREELTDLPAVRERSQRRLSSADISDADIGLEGVEDEGHSFDGEIVCFTGKLKMVRKDAQELVVADGGTISKSVTRKTSVLVLGDLDPKTLRPGARMSSKQRRAVELAESGQRIEIITEQDFHIRLASHKEEIKRRIANRVSSTGQTRLELWAIEALRAEGEGDWFEFLRGVQHPDGRAVGGEPCAWCGSEVPSNAHWIHRNRHVCDYRCNVSIKGAWKRLAVREHLLGF